ncbi:glycerophosphodiester phosphodiesterase domain-containing protein 4 [Apodemus sylvaticus]|uniref:glycerophosphodiester phosphodiesterase domain-containing protein 4 n=1 Tax=Apodemus sylvaticus TaxID=10129 RepID=UPI002241DC1F|nr:glycerophosphodiester phosphodiesterase domain-containing protein 4 [Apodemus sylvaticus]
MEEIQAASSSKPKDTNENSSPWIEQYFNHKCWFTFLTGCYSCEWQYREYEKTELGSCCCSRKEQFFYVCLVIAFILSVLFLFVWVETSNEYNSFDWVVYLGTGRWFLWSILVLSAAGILVAYTTLLLLLGFLLLWERIELNLHTSHKVLIFIVIFLCSILLGVLSHFWKDKWLIVGLSLQIFAPFVHLSLITVMIIISWPLAICVAHLESEVRIRRYRMEDYEQEILERCNVFKRLRALQLAAGLSFLIILLFLYLMPLGIYSPCVLQKENLGPKPTLFGHRGAPMMAPENTMMSFEKAVEFDAFGLETDIFISYDQVPFLMHDYDLTRTTNIREVLPSAARNHSSNFNWTFLSTLNAGQWFLKHKPFYGMKPLSEADKIRAGNQSIPRLTDLLEFAKKEQKFVLFDLFGPAPGHPLRNTFVRRVVRVILDSHIEQHLIFWLPGFDRDYVRYMAPGFQHVGRLWSIDELTKNNISIINVDYKRLFYAGLRDYKKAKIYINVYVINEPWLFSLAWCSSVNSVTTDNIELLNQLSHPLFFMTPDFYLLLWLFLDAFSAIIIGLVFCYHWVKELRKERWLEASVSADVERINLPKEKSEVQRASARIGRSPWTPAVHYGSSSRRQKVPPPRAVHSVKYPEKKPVPFKNTVKPVTQGFQHTKTSAREMSLRTPEPTLKGDEVTGPLTEYSHAKTHQNTPMLDYSEESSDTLESITSNVSYEMPLKKKRP